MTLCIAGTASAQIGGADFSNRSEESHDSMQFRSTQHWATELRFGPYRPNVDGEFSNGQNPWQDFFGKGSSLMFGLEVDYQLWHKFGSLAVGGMTGYFSMSNNNCIGACFTGQRSGDTSSFKMVPINALAIYRFDVPLLRWKVPLVPYLKFGLVYNIWWISGPDGVYRFTTGASNDRALGGTAGITFAGGLSLALDWLDPSASVALDNELGINHTYVFFELQDVSANGLTRSDALHTGDRTWTAGMAFEF
jgi:hypothetical protein